MNIDDNALRKVAEEVGKIRPRFPDNCCTHAATELSKKYGLDIEAGYLCGHGHTWNVDPETEKIYDITAGQFGLPSILVLSREEAINLYGYVPDEEVTSAVLDLLAEEQKQAELESLFHL